MEHPVFENVHNAVRDAECPPLENARQSFRWALGLTHNQSLVKSYHSHFCVNLIKLIKDKDLQIFTKFKIEKKKSKIQTSLYLNLILYQ